jgi:hypothetical protein
MISTARLTFRGLLFAVLATLALMLVASLTWQGVASWRHYRALVDQAEFDQAAN